MGREEKPASAKPKELELLVFRHGRTGWNHARRLQGQTDVALDSLGEAQSEAVATYCATLDPAPRAVFSSDLQRARIAAERISELTGLSVRTDPRLREYDFGAWAGLTTIEIAEKFPDEWTMWRDGTAAEGGFDSAGDERRVGGGETYGEMRERVATFISEVRASYSDGLVVIVTHGGWIRSAIEVVSGGTILRRNMGSPAQGSLMRIRFDAVRGAILEKYNDTCHLRGVSTSIDAGDPGAGSSSGVDELSGSSY